MSALERLGVFKYYPPKIKFEKNDGWKWAPIWMVFDIKQKYLRHKSSLVVKGHVVDSTEHTTYLSTIKDISVSLMLIITVKKVLVIMDGDIGNAFFAAPCAENIWSTCGQ